MARKSLVGVVADELLDRIIAGEFPPGASVPGELELSAAHEVSRMTVREAMKTLEAQRILSVERGRGTFVNPLNRWASLEAVLRAASEGKNEAEASVQLIELRRMLETGACELAAGRIGDADVQTLYGYVAAMRAAHEVNDVAAFVEADLAFHDHRPAPSPQLTPPAPTCSRSGPSRNVRRMCIRGNNRNPIVPPSLDESTDARLAGFHAGGFAREGAASPSRYPAASPR